MTESGSGSPHDGRSANSLVSWLGDQRHLDLLAVIVMSITALLTAWTGFESSKWGGEMSINLSEAGGRRSNAILFSDLQGTRIAYQNSLAIAWTDATADGDDELAATYRALFPEDLENKVAAWESMPESTRPASPLALEEFGDEFEPIFEILEQADERFEAALVANQRSDNYVITTVMSATVLFFAALATKLGRVRLQVAMLTLAIIGLLATIAVVATFPIKL